MRLTGVESGIEIDYCGYSRKRLAWGLPRQLLPGLLNALHNLQGRSPSKEQLTQKRPARSRSTSRSTHRRQDQYAYHLGASTLLVSDWMV